MDPLSICYGPEMISIKQRIGYRAEKRASRFLQKQGLSLITKNFQTRYGEIDLIMQDQHEIVFVEVRYRQNTDFGTASETVSLMKQRRIVKSSLTYLMKNQIPDSLPCRIDVIEITKNDEIRWIKNAFDVEY